MIKGWIEGDGGDYEYLGRCTYPVRSVGPEYEVSCEEPAIVRVWWSDYERDFMLLCPEHWEIVKQEEGIG